MCILYTVKDNFKTIAMPQTQVTQKPVLTLSQIINMSVGFLGIQFAFGLQNANVSRIFQTLGAKIDEIPILWIAAPLTGLVLQPIIGHISDKTWMGKLGRRRPYFMLGAILASLALLVFPNVAALWVAAVLLWLLDASINISMEPFRAFVGDMLPDEQRTSGFAMQSFFIGIGAVISSLLPYLLEKLNVSNEAVTGTLPDTVKYSFYIGAIVYMAAISYTVFTTKEYSPEEMKLFGETNEADYTKNIKTPYSTFFKNGLIWLALGVALSASLFFYNSSAEVKLEKELYVLSMGIAAFGLFQIVAALFHKNKSDNGLVEIMDDLNHLPSTMKQLAVVQFFSWFALFSMWIYSTPALAQHIYNTTDAGSAAYNKIGNWVGVMFAFYNGFAALFAFLLPLLAKKYSRPKTHMIALIAGGLGLISYYIFKNEYLLIISMAGMGLAWSSILSMPYSMLTKTLPSHKMGVYMGIFNFFIVIPQILAATLLGFFTKHLFGDQAILSIVLGGCSMIVAAFLCLRIKDK
jgi:maltose/moltooligosaccharide transporter